MKPSLDFISRLPLDNLRALPHQRPKEKISGLIVASNLAPVCYFGELRDRRAEPDSTEEGKDLHIGRPPEKHESVGNWVSPQSRASCLHELNELRPSQYSLMTARTSRGGEVRTRKGEGNPSSESELVRRARCKGHSAIPSRLIPAHAASPPRAAYAGMAQVDALGRRVGRAPRLAAIVADTAGRLGWLADWPSLECGDSLDTGDGLAGDFLFLGHGERAGPHALVASLPAPAAGAEERRAGLSPYRGRKNENNIKAKKLQARFERGSSRLPRVKA
ncbi:uncharacterized protein VTP21DRAFT_5232 [Calcarisporiella thermophila]|uniref:uncharacterized protein n=1 Tax=Calcarisporiella thermophila TaxID=911321 RepID=UPI0037448675